MFAIASSYETVAPLLHLTEFGWSAWQGFCEAMADPTKGVSVEYNHYDSQKGICYLSSFRRDPNKNNGKGRCYFGKDNAIDLTWHSVSSIV